MSDNARPLTLGLAAGAQLLNLSPGTLRERAAAGLIPGAKIGRAWAFIEADLLEYLRSQYPPCLKASSSNGRTAATSGRATSSMLAGGYASQLDKLIAQRRRSASTKSS